MAFATKTDYVGIGRSGLVCRSNGENASNSILEIVGADGSIIGDEITGHIKAPNCEYALSGNVTLNNLELGKVHGSGNYALSHIHITTGAGQEPTVTADAVQIEGGATQAVCTYAVDSIALTPARHALTFGAFTYTESSSQVLETCEFDATADITPTTVNNEPVASDATHGRETVTITMLGGNEITVTSGWHITSDWTCTGADAALPSYTCTLTKYLATKKTAGA